MKYGLDEIKTFLAVVEIGSISGASMRLAITKSVVSQRVTHLEAALGVELLHRSMPILKSPHDVLCQMHRSHGERIYTHKPSNANPRMKRRESWPK